MKLSEVSKERKPPRGSKMVGYYSQMPATVYGSDEETLMLDHGRRVRGRAVRQEWYGRNIAHAPEIGRDRSRRPRGAVSTRDQLFGRTRMLQGPDSGDLARTLNAHKKALGSPDPRSGWVRVYRVPFTGTPGGKAVVGAAAGAGVAGAGVLALKRKRKGTKVRLSEVYKGPHPNAKKYLVARAAREVPKPAPKGRIFRTPLGMVKVTPAEGGGMMVTHPGGRVEHIKDRAALSRIGKALRPTAALREVVNARRQVGMIAGPEKKAMRQAGKKAAGGGFVGSFRQGFKAAKQGQKAQNSAAIQTASLGALSPERRALAQARMTVAQRRIGA